MIDVLYVMGGLGIGGTERHLSLILPELARRGWRLEVALLTSDGPFGEPLRAAGIPITEIGNPPLIPIPKLRGLQSLRGQARTLADRLRAEPPRMLHCYLPTSCIVGGWAAHAAGFRPVAMSRRSQANRPPLFWGDKWLERRELRAADLVFGHSQWVVKELADEGIKPERIRLVHNGIVLAPRPTNDDRIAVRAAEGWRHGEIIIVAVANLIPYKGHTDLMHAVARMASGGVAGWRLALVGDGAAEYVADLRRLAAELGIADRVSLAGRRTDVARILIGADIGVLPSHQEGFSNALLEYMAAELPVIATATGGNLDAVEEGKTGFLVPVGAPGQLGEALSLLAGDADLRMRLGKAARAKVQAEFSLPNCVARYEEAYRHLLAGKTYPAGASMRNGSSS
jgi:glycosyltransferase involved in cell wall biosynthesis